MRDGRRDREKFEFSLEPRQLALLFLLTLVIVTLVFALGIIVGRGLKNPTGTPTVAQVEGEPAAEEAPVDATSTTEEAAAGEDAEAPKLKFFAEGATQPSRVARAVAKTEKAAPEAMEPVAPQVPVAVEVKPEPVKPKKSAPAAKPAKADTKAAKAAPAHKKEAAKAGTKFTIQVSAFQDRGQADHLVSTLKNKGYQAFIAKAEIPGKGTWYRVRIGQYGSREEAQGVANTLKRKEGIATYVTLR